MNCNFVGMHAFICIYICIYSYSNCEDEKQWACDTCAGGGFCGSTVNGIDSCVGTYKYCKTYSWDSSSSESSDDDDISTNVNDKSSSNGGSSRNGSGNSSRNSNNSNISDGFIVGICVLVVVIIAVIACVVVYKKRQNSMGNQVTYSPAPGYVPPVNGTKDNQEDDWDPHEVRVY